MTVQITTEQVKELRDNTGISVMQCRRALLESSGDMKKALAILKKTSSDIALKKADREAKDGAIIIKKDANKVVLVSLHCETDFVSKGEDFTSLLSKLADIAFTEGLESMRAKAPEKVSSVIQKTGENITLGEAHEVSGGVWGEYGHNGKSGVIVSLEGGNTELARDIAMHITAMKPEYVSEEEITADARKTITEIFEKEISSTNKPEEIKKKMLEGKIASYFKEKILLEQAFIKDDEQTVGKLLQNSGARIKEIKRYVI